MSSNSNIYSCSPKSKRFWLSLAILSLASCGTDQGQNRHEDKGGDHIPTLKTYELSSIPTAARSHGIEGIEYHSTYLRRLVHLSDFYKICLDPKQFTDDDAQSIHSVVHAPGSNDSDRGLLSVIHASFKETRPIARSRGQFADKMTIEIVRSTESCDFYIGKGSTQEFPFDQEEYSSQDKVLAYPGQIGDAEGDENIIPVGYIFATQSNQDIYMDAQYLIGAYIGLHNSNEDASLMNSATSARTSNRGWKLSKNLFGKKTHDSSILLAFASAYHGILKPKHWEQLHSYEEALFGEGEPDRDPDFSFTGTYRGLAFNKIVGNRFLNGVRKFSESIRICFDSQSSDFAEEQQLEELVSEVSQNYEGSVLFELNRLDSSIEPLLVKASTGCDLLISIRNEKQYPFAEKSYDGRYSHDKKIEDADGNIIPIPVLYLNGANLVFDDKKSSDYVGATVQHEFAHFLGFKHSRSPDSILAPAGKSLSWDRDGYDKKMFERFILEWSK